MTHTDTVLFPGPLVADLQSRPALRVLDVTNGGGGGRPDDSGNRRAEERRTDKMIMVPVAAMGAAYPFHT